MTVTIVMNIFISHLKKKCFQIKKIKNKNEIKKLGDGGAIVLGGQLSGGGGGGGYCPRPAVLHIKFKIGVSSPYFPRISLLS